MKRTTRRNIFLLILSTSVSLGSLMLIFIFQINWINLITDWVFILLVIFYILIIEELYRWVKNGVRSELSDIVAIAFFLFLILFISKDILTSIMGALSIYLWFAIFELKEYPIINKILIITLTTYNIIFISGLVSSFIRQPIILNTAYAFSFWIILGLGFLLFGRKYLVIWRFLSPEYLTLFLYIIGWLMVVFIDEFTPIDFIGQKALLFSKFNLSEFFLNIYIVLIIINWIIYFVSGPILDSMLGIKRVKDKDLLNLVDEVKNNLEIKGKVKVGFGNYPIINAMAYGSFLDKRIAIIADNISNLPEDEIKGIVAHELSHTKGKHTLILTFITSIDLVIRMLLGVPATFYDYTFGHPQIPLLGFIILNFGIYIILFIFVRILEGKADLATKQKGYAKELIKALYSLESFYATGREIGLNTMLLCEEKITDYNKIKNYIDTADYLNTSIIKPSKLSLLSNLLNSHPPTYYRIAAVLDDTLKANKEALLPFICLSNSKRQRYAALFENARNQFRRIANEKFQEEFQVEDFSDFMKQIKRKEIFQLDLNKQFLFRHKVNKKFKIGTLIDIKFQNDICDKDLYLIKNPSKNEEEVLNASYYEKSNISIGDQYFFKKYGLLRLQNIELNTNQTTGNLIFVDQQKTKISKDLTKTKLPNPISIINELEGHEVFFKLEGGLKIYYCKKVEIVPDIKNSVLELEASNFNGVDQNLKIKLKDLIIKPRYIFLIFRKNKSFRNDEFAYINWIRSKSLRTYIQLKKPVNNTEIGYILDLNLKFQPKREKIEEDLVEKESYLNIRNIFNENVIIPYNTIDLISFEYNTVSLQKKSDTSIFSKIAYKLLRRFKPHKIIYF